MIIIYFSTKPYLALTACCLHLKQECLRPSEFPDFFLNNVFNSEECPLKVFGEDRRGNRICCLAASGAHAKIYYRALSGIIEIFSIDAKIVDVDYLLEVGMPGLPLKQKTKLLCGLAIPRLFGRSAQTEIARLLENYLL